MTSRSVVIAEPVRTAIGALGGTWEDVPAPDLGAVAIQAAVERAGLKPEEVGTVAMGNVIQAAQRRIRPVRLGRGPGRPAEVGRDERNRHHGDKNDRDNGQDSAHGKVVSRRLDELSRERFGDHRRSK
jgi:Thiolase, N-terminal domain